MTKEVVIVGAGIVGLCSAYYAAQRGHRVTVLDRDGPDGDGCSFGNAGMIVPSHFVPLAAPGVVAAGLRYLLKPDSPFYVKPRLSWDLARWGFRFARAANRRHVHLSAPLLRDLHLASRAEFEALAHALDDDFGLAPTGMLMLCRTEHGLEEEATTAAEARRLGLPAELLTAAATAERDPGLRLDVAGSVYYPLDGHLVPGRLMAALTRALEKAGVRFGWRTEVTGWRTRDARIEAVRTWSAGGESEVESGEFVLAAGVWSDALARGLALDLPMQAGKGYSLTLTHPPRRPKHCSILTEARVAVTPMGDGVRFGGTLELTGIDSTIDPRRVQGIIASACRYYPDFTPTDFAEAPVWCGLRPCSPDGLPYLGRPARYRNLTVATGHSMMGVSLGPVTGRLVAEIVSDEKTSLDLAALSPDRHA